MLKAGYKEKRNKKGELVYFKIGDNKRLFEFKNNKLIIKEWIYRQKVKTDGR